MFNIHITINSFIPESLRTKALEVTINALITLGEGILGEEVLARAGQLSSDGTFGLAFEGALQRAADRFVLEYLEEDEHLVEVIAEDEGFFKNGEVEEALLRVLSEPVRYLEGDEEDRQAIVSQSFATLFPRRRNRKRVRRAVQFLLKCIVSEVWRLPDLWAAYEVLAEHYRRSFAEEKVFHNLPRPDYQRFVGRKKEQAELHRLLSPQSRHFVITIDGIGGIGKSALALEVAHQHRQSYGSLPQSERFDALIWATAKQTILTSQGIQRYNHTFRALDDIYTTIASALQREDITRARREEQEEIVTEALSQQRTLLIIDNLETVDDTRIMNFIHNIPRPTKVIVTTRHRLNVAYPMRLVGMSQEEALELISNEATLKNITLTSPQAIRLYKRTGGVPLAIVWSIAQMSIKKDVEATLTRLSHPSSDIAQFCFEGAIELIRNTPAHHLLMALSLFATDASRDALGYVTDLAILDRDEGLEELERLSLVNKEGDRFALLPLTKSYSEHELGGDEQLEEKFRERWVGYLLEFVEIQSQNRYENLTNVNLDTENIFEAMNWCWKQENFDNIILFARHINFYLWLSGSLGSWNKYIELGLRAAELLEDKESQATFLHSLGTVNNYQGNLGNAKRLINSALNIYELIDHKLGTINCLHRLGTIEYEDNKPNIARVHLKEALSIAEEIEHEERIMDIQRKLADIDISEEKYESAEYRLKKVRDYHEILNDFSWGIPYTYRLSGLVALRRGHDKLAERYFRYSLEMAERIDSKHNVAEAKHALGELALNRGDLDKAKKLAQEAGAIFTALKMERHFKNRIEVLLVQIAAQSEQP